MRSVGALLPALASAGLAACAVSPASEDGSRVLTVVATQVPAGRGAPFAVDPGSRYPEGSRVVAIEPAREGATPHVLSEGLAAAGAPAALFDGTRVLFAGRRTPDAAWAVYETDLRGSRPEMRLELGGGCTDPAPLSGGGLVASCEESGRWSLYVATARGAAPERITFGPGSASDPVPLPDGRILFSMEQWLGAGRESDGAVALFTVNPDGTLFSPFTGSHRPPEVKRLPRLTADGGVVYLASHHDGEAWLERVEMKGPLSTHRGATLTVSTGAGLTPLVPSSVAPLPDGRLLVAGRPGTSRPDSGVYRGTEGRAFEPLFDERGWDEREVVALLARPEPRGRPSAVDRERRTGSLVCYDANRSDRVVGPGPDAPSARDVELETWPESAALRGRADVSEDGSFYLEVPSDRAIRLVSRSAAGEPIARSDWFWVRPGEVRACFGCHESREAAPVNRRVLALAGEPQRLALPEGAR